MILNCPFSLMVTYKDIVLSQVDSSKCCCETCNNTSRICHVTPILEDLHWLPIKYRIEFKIVLLTLKCLYGLAPQYLVDLIAVTAQSRYNLRSRNAPLLVPAKARCLPTLGDRAFQSASPKHHIF